MLHQVSQNPNQLNKEAIPYIINQLLNVRHDFLCQNWALFDAHPVKAC